jgi:hypothetical protein
VNAKIFEVVLHKLPSGKSPATAVEEQLSRFLVSTLQSAWCGGGGRASCNGFTSLSAHQTRRQNALISLD